ncbi:MAG: hypothetical protein AAF296_00885 [Pseudomonadota bacterium]
MFGTKISNTALPVGFALIAFAAAPNASAQSTQENACYNAVQGKIAWDKSGQNTNWNPNNVRKLCRGATDYRAPVNCFRMHMNTGSYEWGRAINQCQKLLNDPNAVEEFASNTQAALRHVGEGTIWAANQAGEAYYEWTQEVASGARTYADWVSNSANTVGDAVGTATTDVGSEIGTALDRTFGSSSLRDFEVAIDCNHSGIDNEDTSNRITVHFYSGNRHVGSRYKNGVRCPSIGADPSFNIQSEWQITHIEVSTNGDNAFYIDELRIFQNNKKIEHAGKDNGRGWCLSTDTGDGNGSWKNFVSKSGCKASHKFTIG